MSDIDNLFMKASRRKLRFDSTRGALTVEDLWDLPLTSSKGFDLNAVGQTIIRELREHGEESLVTTSVDPRKGELELALEIVKTVIATKQADNAKALAASARREERAKILDALARKDDEALTTASRDELLDRLAKIDEDASA